MDSKRLYNSRIIDTYLKLLRARYSDIDRNEILRYAGMESYEVADQGHWFTQQQIDLFHQRCVQLTGNESIAREAGRFATAPGTLGAMRMYGLSLAGPLRAFSLIGASTKKFTRSSDYTSRKISNTKVEITVAAKRGAEEKPFQCENRIGFFEAIVHIFNIGIPKIEHPECMFKGNKVCRYIISWRNNRTTTMRRVRDAALLTAAAATLTSFFIEPALALRAVLPAGAFAVLLTGWLAEYVRAGELDKGMVQLWGASDQLAEQIELNYRNAQLAADVGDVIANRTSISAVIASVVHVLEKTLDYDRGLILLADEQHKRLEIRGAYGYLNQHLDILTNISFSLANPDSRGIFVVSYREQKPFMINNVEEIEETLSPKSLEFVQALGTRSFICVPIVLEGTSIGILAVDNLKTKKPLLASDVNLLMGITPAIAVSIQNVRLLEARTAQFESTLQVLADSIDARDFLTAGHSEKVAEYSVGIAEELGLSEPDCRMIRMAALLHDYGKIAIPDSILKKGGPLSDEEREVIKTHPTKTRQILDKVAFEGPFRDIPAICHAHHERWDGTGYPNALKGEEIPLGARIIAAADVYEAITAERHYRAPMSREEARQTFLAESGRHFQPEIADAFIRHLERSDLCSLAENDRAETAAKYPWGSDRQQRIPYRTEVAVRVDRKVISGTSVNISHGGIFVNSDEAGKLNPTTEIQITFTLPERNSLVRVPGRVAWINNERLPSRHLPKGFGVQFDGLDPEIRETLKSYVESHLAYGSPVLH